jgi:plasmid stabilization system protein ParE
MAYEVRLSPLAVRNLVQIYRAIEAGTSHPAAEWYLGLRDAVCSLEDLPLRGRIAPDKPAFHQILYGNKPHFYRILYTIDEAAKVVNIAQIRHGARKPMS